MLLRRLNPRIKVHLVAPNGVSGISKRLLETIDAEFVTEDELYASDIVLLVDTNTIQQLGDCKERVQRAKTPIIVVDHHARHPETSTIASLMFVDEKCSSACEVIFELYRALRVRLDRRIAQALLIGIAYDSGHFTIATMRTFEIVANLLRLGASLEDALSILTFPMNDSERIARLKAAQRIEFRRIGAWVIATTKISSHQASAARALVALGAHVAVAAGDKDSELRMSMRSNRQFNKGTGIHLGKDLARPLGEAFLGMGGGHESAAGVNGSGPVENALAKFLEILHCLIPPIG